MSLSEEAHQRLIEQAQRPVPTVTAEDLNDLLNAYEVLVAQQKRRHEITKRLRTKMKNGEQY